MVLSVRLACLIHAASVHPEPGSNSPKNLQTDADFTLTDADQKVRASPRAVRECLRYWDNQKYFFLVCTFIVSISLSKSSSIKRARVSIAKVFQKSTLEECFTQHSMLRNAVAYNSKCETHFRGDKPCNCIVLVV